MHICGTWGRWIEWWCMSWHGFIFYAHIFFRKMSLLYSNRAILSSIKTVWNFPESWVDPLLLCGFNVWSFSKRITNGVLPIKDYFVPWWEINELCIPISHVSRGKVAVTLQTGMTRISPSWKHLNTLSTVRFQQIRSAILNHVIWSTVMIQNH